MKAFEELFIHQFVNVSKLHRRIDNQLSIHGISLNEYIILYQLAVAEQNTLRRIELAELVGVTASGVTRLLAPMEKNGLIEKRPNPRDARVSLVVISKVGQNLLNDAMITFSHVASNVTNNLTDRQQKKLNDLLSKLA